ncbi:MAG TPA: TIGR03564 family F420-dependent LLM class oxidoreductase [Acidimicrobiales bacterium]|nr:TIGR03564 family F420-dependent LLM class oxidoreductase [Acidimicrobiales bacterium]
MTLRIGISGGGQTIDRLIDHAREAEADGFTSLWFAGAAGVDPFAVLPLVGRATDHIELGTSIVQTYPRHPVLMADQAAGVSRAVGDGRFTLGVGVSHRPVIEGVYGLSYDSNARHLREYLTILRDLLHEGRTAFHGEEYRATAELRTRPDEPVPVVVAALAPRSLRSAGELADGTITWMANATAVESLIAPTIAKAASDAGRPAPRIITGLPVAVTDDVDAAREAAARQFAVYGMLPNYQRVLAAGGVTSPADAAIVGSEAQVATAIEGLVAAGATDVWAAAFPVGDDRRASRQRTRALLRDLVAS